MTRLDPELEAQGVLRTRWVRNGDKTRVPVDPIAIAHNLGLDVFMAPLSEGVSGMLTSNNIVKPAIYLSSQDAPVRRRFTCAHEIGHWIHHELKGETAAIEFVDLRAHLSSRGVDQEEIWANQFAAALLMPAEVVRALLPSYGESGVAYRLDVSLSAVGFRVENLRNHNLL